MLRPLDRKRRPMFGWFGTTATDWVALLQRHQVTVRSRSERELDSGLAKTWHTPTRSLSITTRAFTSTEA